MPWLIIIAAMLATPLAQVRPRQGRWLRLLPSVLIFASCAISIISLRTAIGKERISEYAYIWLILGFIAFALLLNWQSRVVHRVHHFLLHIIDNAIDFLLRCHTICHRLIRVRGVLNQLHGKPIL